METLLLKGKVVSDAIRIGLQPRIKALQEDGIVPQLAAILVGEDPASQVYVRNKGRAFDKQNCKSQTFQLEADLDEQSRKSIQKQQRKAASSAEKEKRGQSAGQKTSAEKQKERVVTEFYDPIAIISKKLGLRS